MGSGKVRPCQWGRKNCAQPDNISRLLPSAQFHPFRYSKQDKVQLAQSFRPVNLLNAVAQQPVRVVPAVQKPEPEEHFSAGPAGCFSVSVKSQLTLQDSGPVAAGGASNFLNACSRRRHHAWNGCVMARSAGRPRRISGLPMQKASWRTSGCRKASQGS